MSSKKSSNKKVRGAAKHETMQDKIEKAREKKEAAKERKQEKAEVVKPQTSIPKVQRNAQDKKLANFLHQARTNREKQRASKRALLGRMQEKLAQIQAAKDQDSDDEGDEGDEGEEVPEGEEEEGDGEEELALQEFEGELPSGEKVERNTTAKRKKPENAAAPAEVEEDEDEDDDEDDNQGALREVTSMEDLKKMFSGKRVASVEVDCLERCLRCICFLPQQTPNRQTLLGAESGGSKRETPGSICEKTRRTEERAHRGETSCASRAKEEQTKKTSRQSTYTCGTRVYALSFQGLLKTEPFPPPKGTTNKQQSTSKIEHNRRPTI